MKETPLIDAHRTHRAKLVDFAGWLMPIQYGSVLEEYHAVRQAVGLFDVSHMGRIRVSGPQALSFLQWICISDVQQLESQQAQYSMICQEDGGILDDVFIYRTGQDEFLVCVNASNRTKIVAWLQQHQPTRFPEALIEDQSEAIVQLAIQGPASQKLVERVLGPTAARLKPRWALSVHTNNFSGLLSRTGYTGEIGYEWYLPAAQANQAWERLLKEGVDLKVKPAGLGARDLLRLDVGYLLYGQEIDESTTPLEANAEWLMAWDKGPFQGRDALQRQKGNGLSRKLIAFEMIDRGIPRHKMPIQADEAVVGEVTSGNFSPILEKGIGLGYVPPRLAKPGITMTIDIRGKSARAVVAKLPFYKRQKS